MTEELMTRARLAIEAEEAARLEAKATELATADERARLEAEQEARREEVRAAASQALSDPAISLAALAKKFDAAVAALVDLVEAAEARNLVIRQQAVALGAADVQGNRSHGGNGLVLDGEGYSIRDAKPAELVARTVAVAANEVGTPDNGLRQLASDVLPHSGPLGRATAVERARRS